jgi:hypothetical protein
VPVVFVVLVGGRWVVWILVVVELQRVSRSVRELRKKKMMITTVLMIDSEWYLY